jgi:hypothetical protein
MATPCYTQLGFGFQPKLVVDFAGGEITSDAGLLLLRDFDDALGLTDTIVSCLADDRRDARYVTHASRTLLRQRLYQIVAGYEDANDATALRHDATLQLVAGEGRPEALGSQPTLSRWENEASWRAIRQLAQVGLTWFCAHAFAPGTAPREIILEPDGTDDPAHGAQQLALFVGGRYGQRMYQPLIWTEGHTQLPLRARVRPGRSGQAAGALADLRALLPPLRRRFPRTAIRLRADAGFATPPIEAALEAEAIEYVLAIGPNPVFTRRIAALRARAERRFARTGRAVQRRTSFRHRACRWPRQRRILVDLAVTGSGTVVRYYVTNRRGRAADLIAWYAARGEAENRIKEWKNDLHADRLSCHRYRANAMRLQLHTLAFLLLAYFRHWLLALTPLARASVATIRTQLLKVGARVVRSVRRIWVHLASSWPGRAVFLTVHAALARAPARR